MKNIQAAHIRNQQVCVVMMSCLSLMSKCYRADIAGYLTGECYIRIEVREVVT